MGQGGFFGEGRVGGLASRLRPIGLARTFSSWRGGGAGYNSLQPQRLSIVLESFLLSGFLDGELTRLMLVGVKTKKDKKEEAWKHSLCLSL